MATQTRVKRERVSKNNIVTMNGQPVNLLDELADEKAERAVIDCVLRAPELFPLLSTHLQSGDFFILMNGYVWWAFNEILAAGKKIDRLEAAAVLARKDPAKQGAQDGKSVEDYYLEKLIEYRGAAPVIEHAEQYVERVRAAALRKRTMEALDKGKELAMDKSLSIEELKSAITEIIFRALERTEAHEEHVQEISGEYYDIIEARSERAQEVEVRTGFEDIDAVTPFYPGEVNVLVGGAGMGKTTLMLSILRNVAANRTTVLFTLEMDRYEIMQSLVAMETGIYRSRLQSGDLTGEQWRAFATAVGTISKWKLYIVDEYSTLTPLQMKRKLYSISIENPVEAVFCDGLWLMESDDPKDNDPANRARAVTNITSNLKDTAKECAVPIVITHQYNRSYQGDTPMMSYLAESSGVERNTHVIWGMHRPGHMKRDKENTTTLHLLKNRNRSTSQEPVGLYYNASHNRYESGTLQTTKLE